MTKQQRFKQIWTIATGLLLFAIILFIITHFLQAQYPWLKIINAFAEAAMVGAFADWFAVVALFRHPLGIPIPHTNLLEEKRKELGNSLGEFIVNNFLSENTLNKQLEKMNISINIANWLKNPNNNLNLTNELIEFMPLIINTVNENEINKLIDINIRNWIQKIDFTEILARLLNFLAQNKQHQKLISEFSDILRAHIQQKDVQQQIEDMIDKNRKWFMPSAINEPIANSIIEAVENQLLQIKHQPNHTVRVKIDTFMQETIENLQKNTDYKNKANQLKEQLLSSQSFNNIISNSWGDIKKLILNDLEKPNSTIHNELHKALNTFSERIEANPELQKIIDIEIKKELSSMVLKNQSKIAEFVSDTVVSWQNLGEKLELEVGADLQFIRINGTLVGGMVGVILYLIFEVLL